MTRIIKYKIDDEKDQVLIKEFLKKRGYSSKIISLIKRTENGITVDGKYVFVTHRLTTGNELIIKVLDEKPSETIVKKDIPIDIIYEDEDLLVLNKQAGIAVHPSMGHFDTSLANGVMNYFDEDFVFRCINRLDKNTSGLLIIAKNKLSSAILSDMIKDRDIQREYLAICKGDFPFKTGKIDAPIARVDGSTIEREVSMENGATAITNYNKVICKNGYSLINLTLETGRTHQIRVHLKHIGYPLVGDFLYNPDYDVTDRHALHSYKLQFNHPITKQKMTFTQELPHDMSNIIK